MKPMASPPAPNGKFSPAQPSVPSARASRPAGRQRSGILPMRGPRAPSSFSKGFFFTVLALVLVSFMLVSVQLWAQSQQISEQRQAERFRLEAMRSSLALVSNASLTAFANASMIYALNNLSNALQEHPDAAALPCSVGPNDLDGSCNRLGTGPYQDGTYLVNVSVGELMIDGTTSGHIFTNILGCPSSASGLTFYSSPHGANCNLTYSPAEQKYRLSNYFNQTAQAAELLGYNLTWGPVENFVFNQTDAWHLVLSFTVNATLTDRGNTLNITKHLSANVVLDINGLTDPLILRSDQSYRTNIAHDAFGLRPHRNVYHVAKSDGGYDSTADASAALLLGRSPAGAGAPHTTEGLGWFFGPVLPSRVGHTSFSDQKVVYNSSHISSFIYRAAGTADAVSESAFFGAIIIEGAHDPPQYRATKLDTTSCPSGTYTTFTQQTCLYCLQYTTTSDERLCPLGSRPDINHPIVDPASVPLNPAIPYVAITGSLPDTGHPNYFSGLDEVLIDSKNNASIFGPPDHQNLNHDKSYLDQKFADFISPTPVPPAEPSNSTIWDLTGPRDVALCGFYVQSLFGPSYLQRYTAQTGYAYRPYSPAGQYYYSAFGRHFGYSYLGEGIESFVVGKWAGGKDDANAQGAAPDADESRSRVDYLFYQGASNSPQCYGWWQKGLPGCKSLGICSADEPYSPTAQSPRGTSVGRFALTPGATPMSNNDGGPVERYGLLLLTISNPFQVCK